MKIALIALALTTIYGATAFSQQTATSAKAPILDGYPVVVQSVKVVTESHRGHGGSWVSDGSEQLLATINYPYGCDTTQALIVVGTYPIYHIYAANDQKRNAAIHCGAFSNEVTQVKVTEFFDSKTDKSVIKVNGVAVTN